MIARIAQVLSRRQDGFTLVELLTVVTIIGTLTALAAPMFREQRQKPQDTVAKSFAHMAMVAMETYGNEHDDYTATKPDLVEVSPELKDALPQLSVTGAARTYQLVVTSRAGRDFRVERRPDGQVVRSCGPDGGACSAGTW